MAKKKVKKVQKAIEASKKVSNFSNKKTPLWYWLRGCFTVMILIWVIQAFLIINYGTTESVVGSILSLVWLVVIIATFIMSIMHLKRYKQKAFAIVALIFSGLLLAMGILGGILGAMGIYDPTAMVQ